MIQSMSSSFPPRVSPPLSSSQSGVAPSEDYHFYFKLSCSQLPIILQSFKFGAEELFHDTIFYIGECLNGRTLCLRRRRNLLLKSDPTWLITESSENNIILRLNQDSPVEIEHLLKEKSIPFSKDSPLEDQFQICCKFRFYRRDAEDEQYGHIHIDETLLGIILSFHVTNKSQLDNVTNLANHLNLFKTSSKFMTLKNGGPVPEHLFGPRQDMLEREDSDSENDDAWIDEWNSLVSAQSATPPLGNPQFTDSSPEIVRARQLFDDMLT